MSHREGPSERRSSGTTSSDLTAVLMPSPRSNQSVTNPVAFSASATSKVGVSSIVLTIDGVPFYTSHSNTLNTSLNLALGSHRYLYIVWDKAGHSTKEGGTITVN